MLRTWLTLAVVLTAALAGCKTRSSTQSTVKAASENVGSEAGGFCSVGPVRVNLGDKLPSTDGCNTCTCTNGGSFGNVMACTEIGCVDAPTPQGCKVGDAVMKLNTSLKSADNCNTCSCTSSGIACTEIACVPNEDQPSGGGPAAVPGFCTVGPVLVKLGGKLFSTDGCNTCTCTNGGGFGNVMACTEIGCVDAPTPQGCKVGDAVMKLNTSLKSADNCNTCSCTSSGIACTEIACVPN